MTRPVVGKEVEFGKTSGTAWSHAFLNQKSWHPLSYPNQKRLWIAQQSHAVNVRKTEEVAREFAQEQEFFRQTSVLSGKEKKKLEDLQAVGFLYARPPGYNAESAHAAIMEEERKKKREENMLQPKESSIEQAAEEQASRQQGAKGASLSDGKDTLESTDKKKRVRDVFGRTIPTEEEFSMLKDAPRMATGLTGRVKPFAIEVRNVRCARCGNFGHQSGDRECPLKGVVGATEMARQAREDPLTLIHSQMELEEPTVKWELKQQPGACSPVRGGFSTDHPNQQFVPPDVFDEYGGFLAPITDRGGMASVEEGGLSMSIPPAVMASISRARMKELKEAEKAERRKERRERKREKDEGQGKKRKRERKRERGKETKRPQESKMRGLEKDRESSGLRKPKGHRKRHNRRFAFDSRHGLDGSELRHATGGSYRDNATTSCEDGSSSSDSSLDSEEDSSKDIHKHGKSERSRDGPGHRKGQRRSRHRSKRRSSLNQLREKTRKVHEATDDDNPDNKTLREKDRNCQVSHFNEDSRCLVLHKDKRCEEGEQEKNCKKDSNRDHKSKHSSRADRRDKKRWRSEKTEPTKENRRKKRCKSHGSSSESHDSSSLSESEDDSR